MAITELYEIKGKLFKNYWVYKLYSACKCHCRYSDLGYDMFNMFAISGYHVAQSNSKILHGTLKCMNIDDIDDLLNNSFQLRNVFGFISLRIAFNEAPQKISHMCSDSVNMAAKRFPFPWPLEQWPHHKLKIHTLTRSWYPNFSSSRFTFLCTGKHVRDFPQMHVKMKSTYFEKWQ